MCVQVCVEDTNKSSYLCVFTSKYMRAKTISATHDNFMCATGWVYVCVSRNLECFLCVCVGSSDGH